MEAKVQKVVEPLVVSQVAQISVDEDKIELPLTASQIVNLPEIITLGKNDSYKEPDNEEVKQMNPEMEKGIKMNILSESFGSNKNHSVLYLGRDEYFSKTWLI